MYDLRYRQLEADYTSATLCRIALHRSAQTWPECIERFFEAREAEEAARIALSAYVREQLQELPA